MALPCVLSWGQRVALETRRWTHTNPRVAIRESGVTPRRVPDAQRIGTRPRKRTGCFAKGEYLKTILNRHRLVRWVARTLQQLRDDFAPAAAARQPVTAAQPDVAHGSAVPLWASRPTVKQTFNQPHRPQLPTSGSPQESTPSPAYVQLAVWRQMWGLHNKERARFTNPLTSANSVPDDLFPHGAAFSAGGCAVMRPGPAGGPPGLQHSCRPSIPLFYWKATNS